MPAPFRAADEDCARTSSISAMIAAIAQHHRAIQDILDDLERARRSGADFSAVDNRLGAAHDFAAHNARLLNALRTGDMDAVHLADLAILARYAQAPQPRLAAE